MSKVEWFDWSMAPHPSWNLTSSSGIILGLIVRARDPVVPEAMTSPVREYAKEALSPSLLTNFEFLQLIWKLIEVAPFFIP